MKPDWNRRFAAGLLAILLCLCSFSIDEYMKRHLEIKLISSIVTKAETV